MSQFNYLYKITNLVNRKIYIGVHQTDNLDDGYMGSGKRLKQAQMKYGRNNFKKEILEFFDTSEEMFEKEHEIVNEEFVASESTYNLVIGGRYGGSMGLVSVKDKNGNHFCVSPNDPRYLSGELTSISCGYVVVKNKNEIYFRVFKDDPRYLSGELVGVTKGFIPVKDNKENTYQVSIDDPRYLSGELVPIWTGKKHSEETKRKIGQKNAIHQSGEGNSQYGTMWIYNQELKVSKKISKEELDEYLKQGWLKGRKMKF